jgi:anti-sigma factor RsiW
VTDERPIGEDDLQAYIDGRLMPARREEVEAYLAANPAAAAETALEAKHREALRARLAFKASEPIPARLRVANLMAAKRRAPRFRLASVAAAVAWLAIGLVCGALGSAWIRDGHLRPFTHGTNAAGDAITAYRTYVTERLHPVEVAADQEAHLVQWLSRRLGKPLVAPNLNQNGYRLMGGRLLPAGNQPAAMFMYEDGRGNRLTLYARSGDAEGSTAFRFENQDGVSAFSWIDDGLSYVVAGRIGREDLLTVAETIYKQFEGQAPPGRSKL